MRSGSHRSTPSQTQRLLFVVAALLVGPSHALAERERVVVQPGDVLSRIAESHSVSVSQIREWNTLAGDVIRVGQRLWVGPEEARAPEPPPPPPIPEGPRSTYVVLRGDNMNRIAARVGVPIEILIAANPTVRRDRLRPGQTLLVVGATRVVEHRVRRGESLARLASRYEVTVRELTQWNPTVRGRELRADSTLVIYTDVRISRSMSIGSVNAGRLEHAERLPEHPLYEIRDPARAYGTAETVQWFVEAFATLFDSDPRAPRVRVHDVSRAEGGHLADHRSHQSGRDVDVAYFSSDCRRVPCSFRTTSPESLDVRRQWALFRYWLEAGVIDMIFVDRSLHEVLYEEARRTGATAEQLSRWFQYPRGSGNPYGAIRHFANHANHFHVRFICPQGDDACESRPNLSHDDE